MVDQIDLSRFKFLTTCFLKFRCDLIGIGLIAPVCPCRLYICTYGCACVYCNNYSDDNKSEKGAVVRAVRRSMMMMIMPPPKSEAAYTQTHGT